MKKLNALCKQFICLAVTGFLLSACEAPKGESDFRANHPIVVVQENVAISFVDLDRTQELSGDETAYFERFMSNYHLRGQGPVVIQASETDGYEVLKDSRIKAMRELLLAAGVSKNMIKVLPFNAENGADITLSFIANTVKVPDCGNWESSSSFNWSNRRQSNFGCAIQRNLGLTIANPGDLNQPNTLVPGDGEKSAGTIDTFRAPAIPGAAAAPAAP